MLTAGRTRYVMLGAALAIAAAVALVGPSSPAPFDRIAGAALLVVYPCLTALVCWWCAWEMTSSKMKTQWILLGAGAVLFGMAQYLEGFGGFGNLPGLTPAKGLYLAAIVAFGLGVCLALRAFAALLDVRGPVRISVTLAAIASALGAAVLARMVLGMDVGLVDKIVLSLYPIGVLWFMAVPALALAMTVSQMGKGAVARPWWAVWLGTALITCSNLLLVVLTALGTPVNNAGPMEFGWWIGMAAIAIGAGMQIDVQKPSQGAAAWGWTDGESA